MPKRRMRKVRESTAFTLGALAPTKAIVAAGPVMVQGGFITTSKIAWQLQGLTAGEGQGLFFGIADGQLSATEIEECLEAGGPTFEEEDPVAHRTDRRVRILDYIGPRGELNPSTTQVAGFHKYETRIAFSEEQSGWKWFAWNHNPSAITTGAQLRILGTHNVQWEVL